MLKLRTMLLVSVAACALLSLSSATANAQRHRQNPSDQLTADARQRGPCKDPWITIAIWDFNGGMSNPQGVADAGECDPNLYGGVGSWNSYDQLYNVVEPTIRYLHNSGRSFKILSDGRVGGTTSVLMLSNGFVTSQRVISNNLITSDGASIARVVSQGGGNVVSQGGGNVLSDGSDTLRIGNSVLALRNGDVVGIVVKQGSNVIGTGGASIQQLRAFSFRPSGGYGLQSTGGDRLPKATIVIQ